MVGIFGGLIAMSFKARSAELPRWYLILVLAGVLLALPARGLTVRYRARISAMCKVRMDAMGELWRRRAMMGDMVVEVDMKLTVWVSKGLAWSQLCLLKIVKKC